jgi:hypothetical protein
VPKIELKVKQKTCKKKTKTSMLAYNKGGNHPLVRPRVRYRNSVGTGFIGKEEIVLRHE